MTSEEVRLLPLGIYIVRWTDDGGTSVAAVGMDEYGNRWLAPTNWVIPDLYPDWNTVDSMELILTQNSVKDEDPLIVKGNLP